MRSHWLTFAGGILAFDYVSATSHPFKRRRTKADSITSFILYNRTLPSAMEHPYVHAVGVVILLYAVYRRYTRLSLKDVPGPEPESYLLGNTRQLLGDKTGEADFAWQERFGGIIRIKYPLGRDRLMISDPKAVNYILQTSGYNFAKPDDRREISLATNGESLVWADGQVHKRQRKVMLPGFGGPESKALFPVFRAVSERLVAKWKDILASSEKGSVVINAPHWLSRATLDGIGRAAFDYEFNSLDNAANELGSSYNNLMADVFGLLSPGQIFFQGAMHYLPKRVLRWLLLNPYISRGRRLRKSKETSRKVATELIQMKRDALLQGEGSRDVMSLLVKADASENEKAKLTEEELISQMAIIMFAGHETTANTLSWAMWEFAKHPEIQARLREEIRATELTARERGESELSLTHIESMPYLQAFIKEVLRVHPVAIHMHREATKDDLIPVLKPVRLMSGQYMDSVAVPKGTKIVISIPAYNRNKDLWGEDAHVFNPERWLSGAAKDKKGPSVGVVGNLLTFSGGLRSCIGWRFAMTELQAFVVDLVNNFEIAMTEEATKVRRESALVMVPMVDGQLDKGVQLPLKISVASRD